MRIVGPERQRERSHEHQDSHLILSRLLHRGDHAADRLFRGVLRNEMLPGDTASILLGQAATPEAVAGLRTAMHLDEPAILRFMRWFGRLLTGDLGTSYANDMPIADLIGGRFVNTLKLAGVTALFSVPIALTLGITAP